MIPIFRPSVIAIFSFSAAFSSVRITENSPARLRFHWEMGKIDTATLLDSGKLSTAIDFSNDNFSLGSIGEPVIPGYSFFAGIPSSGAVRVSFTAGPTRRLALSHPLKIHRRVAGEPQLPHQHKDFQFLDPWISEPRYTAFRDLRAVQLVIRPVRYTPGATSAELLQSGECTIEFPVSQYVATKDAAPSGDYRKMVRGLLLNDDVAHSWFAARQAGLHKMLTSGSDAFPFDYSLTVKTFTIGDGHDGMHEGTIRENGILKLSGSQVLSLLGVAPGALAMSRVALYASVKGALPERIPDPGAIPSGVVEIPLLRVDNDHNGLVDNDDFFLAYVTGLNDWAYDSLRKDFIYDADDYDDNRHYFLTVKRSGAGATMKTFAQPSWNDADTLDSFVNRARFKELNARPQVYDTYTRLPEDRDGPGWVWALLQKSGSFTLRLDLPDLDSSAGGTLHIQTFNSSAESADIELSGVSLCSACNNLDRDLAVKRWGDREVRIRYTGNSAPNTLLQIERIDARYGTRLSMATDTMRIHCFSSTDAFPHRYRLSGINGKRVYLFRIPDDERSITLIDTVSGRENFIWTDSVQSGARYSITSEAGLITLDNKNFSLRSRKADSSYFHSKLRDPSNESGYLIVTHPAFFSEAMRLADHKARLGVYKPVVVNVTTIYDDFSGGNVDPAAIRNFFAYARRNWTNGDRLDYAVLFGEGNGAFKGLTEEIFIPPYESGGLCMEGFYSAVDPGGSASEPSFALGRIPCLNIPEAQTIVNKIIRTEDPKTADWGAWRNSMLLVADDDRQKTEHDDLDHHGSSDRIGALVESLQPSMDIKKVYEFEYPSTVNREKPEASRALINVINNGVGYVNFFGHGAPECWTDEHILTFYSGSQFVNYGRYPIVSSFSCSVGKFDIPDASCISEMLLKAPNAGAVATFSSTRLASSGPNENLAGNMYAALFDTASPVTVGMAVLRAKSLTGDGNSSSYALLGDPSIRLVNTRRRVRLRIDTANNASVPPADTFKALQHIVIKGAVLDENNAPDNSFGSSGNGHVQITVFNPPYTTARKDGLDDPVSYTLPGAPIFSGTMQVKNGAFTQKTVIPLGVELDKAGSKLIAYAWEGPVAARGAVTTLYFHGSNPVDTGDLSGPRILLRPCYSSNQMKPTTIAFTDQITASLPFSCEIVLDDPNGIDVTHTGPDEGLTMEVPGRQGIGRRNIDTKFQFTEGDYRRGSALVSFESGSSTLPLGRNDLVITARDLLGNFSRVKFTLNVVADSSSTRDSSNALSLGHVFNAPNPMRMGGATTFYILPTRTSLDDAPGFTIKIYTLGGRLVRLIQNATNPQEWDGRDQRGYPLPPNVYLYRVSMRASSGFDKPVAPSKIQKLVIHPPR
jgi:hypothetical protein